MRHLRTKPASSSATFCEPLSVEATVVSRKIPVLASTTRTTTELVTFAGIGVPSRNQSARTSLPARMASLARTSPERFISISWSTLSSDCRSTSSRPLAPVNPAVIRSATSRFWVSFAKPKLPIARRSGCDIGMARTSEDCAGKDTSASLNVAAFARSFSVTAGRWSPLSRYRLKSKVAPAPMVNTRPAAMRNFLFMGWF